MKVVISLFLITCSSMVIAQEGNSIHISKLELGRKKKEVFASRDSSAVVHIDTLIMKDRAQLIFFGKKDVKM